MSVYLVGAGPGDPALMTLRGAELVRRADVIVHDRLVDDAVLAMASPDAELIDVGKGTGSGEPTQHEINQLLIDRARKGQLVVRLKGGDPYVFGRGGEEATALEISRIPYEVVPGVSSLAAVPGAAGVPLTMRGVASSVTVVTGHDPAALETSVSFAALAAAETLVILMGYAQRAELATRLIAAGKEAGTPVLVVESGTTPAQRSTRTTLAALASVRADGPVTIVVGQVAGMSLASYPEQPPPGPTDSSPPHSP